MTQQNSEDLQITISDDDKSVASKEWRRPGSGESESKEYTNPTYEPGQHTGEVRTGEGGRLVSKPRQFRRLARPGRVFIFKLTDTVDKATLEDFCCGW